MSAAASETIRRLGHLGTIRALSDLLDDRRLVRLANSVGLSYPGMRTSSQKRDTLLNDVAHKALEGEAARRAVLRALDKASERAGREWRKLSVADKERRLRAVEAANGGENLGVHLYLVARHDQGDGLDESFRRLMSGPLVSSAADSALAGRARKLGREADRLAKKLAEMEKKAQRQDAQLKKARENEKKLKQDLAAARVALREAATEQKRLRGELRALDDDARRSLATGAVPVESLDKLTRSVRKLASEQRKLLHEFERKPRRGAGPDAKPFVEALHDTHTTLRKEQTSLRRERRRLERTHAGQLDDLRHEVQALKAEVAKLPRTPARAARRGPDRIGVFIDVQNVYYGARQLKGKLDFEKLLETAVGDRRMIESTAYVVESKDSDQSGFIKILQKLAIEVRRKTLTVRADGSMKGDWDMEMALDILDAAPKLDVVVLVSGDGDFTSLLHRVKRVGPRVEVISFPRTAAKSLIESADLFTPLDRKFMIRQARRKTSRSRGAPARTDKRASGS